MTERGDGWREASSSLPPDPQEDGSTESLPEGRSERGAAARWGRLDSRGRRRFTRSERDELLEALESSGESVQAFCAARGLHASTVHGWVGRKRAGTLRRSKKRQCPRYTPEQRRAACEAFARSGRSAGFGRVVGLA